MNENLTSIENLKATARLILEVRRIKVESPQLNLSDAVREAAELIEKNK
jgi:hypothetical protein